MGGDGASVYSALGADGAAKSVNGNSQSIRID